MADVYTRIGLIKGPQGDTGATGATGAQGDAATITVGTTSTTAYGNPAQVTNVGTSGDAILNFVIPQGAPGATVTQMDNLALNTITTATADYPQIQIGDTGSTIFGKIIKFFQDLVSKKVDTSAVVNNFTTTQAGYVADARTVNTLMDALTPTTRTPSLVSGDTSLSSASGIIYEYPHLYEVFLSAAKNGEDASFKFDSGVTASNGRTFIAAMRYGATNGFARVTTFANSSQIQVTADVAIRNGYTVTLNCTLIK